MNLNSLRSFLTDNAPTILTGLGIGGMLTTVVLAVKATPEAHEKIEELDPDCGVDEVIKEVWVDYLPATAMGLVSVSCIIGSLSVSRRKNAAIFTAYSLTDNALKEYKGKVSEMFGKKKSTEIRDSIHKDKISTHQDNQAVIIGSGDVLCYDSTSGRYFHSDAEKIRSIRNDLNERLMDEMFIELNDLYYELGIPPIKVGNDLGWDIDDGQIELTFSSQLTEDNKPCLVLDYYVEPRVKLY